MHRSCMGQQGGWTVIFTLLASAAKSYETRVVSRYLAERTKPPVTPVRTGYRPDYYINDTLYSA